MYGEVFGQGLSERVAVYVPSTFGVADKADSALVQNWIIATHRFLAGQFGGATSQLALGSWVADSGLLVTEDVTIVYAYAARLTRADLGAIKTYAISLKQAFRQETVAIEINGSLFFT